MNRQRGDEGMATVFVLGLMLALGAVTAVVVAIGALLVTRHRVAAAADLAALAVAEHALEGQDAACAAGRRVAQAQGGRLVTCRVGDTLDAIVSVAARAPGRPDGSAPSARSRQSPGPGSGDPQARAVAGPRLTPRLSRLHATAHASTHPTPAPPAGPPRPGRRRRHVRGTFGTRRTSYRDEPGRNPLPA